MKIQQITYKDVEEKYKFCPKRYFKQQFSGDVPSVFIGRQGYPQVNIGMLSPQISQNTQAYASPRLWSQQHYSIGQVAEMRYGLVNARSKGSITQVTKHLRMIQELARAKVPAEVEIALAKKPVPQFKQDRSVTPYGPAAMLHKAELTCNVKVDNRVERLVEDTDLKAAQGIMELYKRNFEEQTTTNLLSVGSLGVGTLRKVVPTRWSITATDDTIGKALITQVRGYQEGEYAACFGGGWGNYYLLLFFPGVWSFELFEIYLAHKIGARTQVAYSTDFEDHTGRTQYAQNTAGGYYAARLPVLEILQKYKQQCSCLALRFITSDYDVPLGVWVCREAARRSATGRIIFSDDKLLVDYAMLMATKKFGLNLSLVVDKSKLLRVRKQQMKLSQWN